MTRPRPEDFARHFPENGMKLLLSHPANVRDLLRLLRILLARYIDFARLQLDPTTYVQRDYRHVESDVVLRGPLKGRRRGRILIYILIEHQSEPDRLMAFRVLEYVVQIYAGQLREWSQSHASLAGFQFQPVLPVVFYTGERPWPTPGRLADLLAGGRRFASLAPVLEPVFFNLRDTAGAALARAGGAFGQLLRLYQRRRAPLREFRPLLQQVVQALERHRSDDSTRWKDLLSYLHALVYHEREVPEHEDLQDRIAESVRATDQQEIRIMGKSIAQTLREVVRREEQVQSRRQTLLQQLRVRFGDLPQEMVDAIEGCADVAQLEAWLIRFATARRLSDMGIPTHS